MPPSFLHGWVVGMQSQSDAGFLGHWDDSLDEILVVAPHLVATVLTIAEEGTAICQVPVQIY